MTITLTDQGHRYLTVNGHTSRIDALPPDDHQPTGPIPAGYAIAPCTACRKPLARILATPGHHLGCPATPLRICGTGKTWTTLHVLYRGERPGWWARFIETSAIPHRDAA